MNSSQRDRFGPLAIKLGARHCARGSSECLSFHTAGLTRQDREQLRSWSRTWSGLEDSEEAWIEFDSSLLELAAGDCDLAAVLLAAQAASSTPPPRPLLMGVLNVTPDSFSDGGLHFEHDQAVARGLDLLAQGAHWLDIGGESTRPGADPVTIEEELRRVVPVIQTLRQEGCKRLSIDTRHARVAAAAIEAGATMVNDVGAGLDDDGMLDVVRDSGCDWVLMHRQGSPGEMQRAPRYGDAVADICDFLRCRVAHCLEAGVQESALWVDPGIGFGKALEHNLEILRRLPELRSLGIPLLLGPSRKSFIGHVTGAQQEADWQRVEARDDPKLRLGGTAAAITFCVLGGAQILRVHDVAVMAEASAVAAAIAAHPNPLTQPPC